MRSYQVRNSRHSELAGDHNRIDVNDLSVRNNLAIEDAAMSPPKVRSAKEFYSSQSVTA